MREREFEGKLLLQLSCFLIFMIGLWLLLNINHCLHISISLPFRVLFYFTRRLLRAGRFIEDALIIVFLFIYFFIVVVCNIRPYAKKMVFINIHMRLKACNLFSILPTFFFFFFWWDFCLVSFYCPPRVINHFCKKNQQNLKWTEYLFSHFHKLAISILDESDSYVISFILWIELSL